MKIALLGAGSYTFGPSVIWQILVEQRFDGIELALMDIDVEALGLLAQIAHRIIQENQLDITITQHSEWGTALDKANYVISCFAPRFQQRMMEDSAVIDSMYPGHLKTEFGGVLGISYSLYQIEAYKKMCLVIKQYCPEAYLLNTANPLPRVCQATETLGVKTIGLCSVSDIAFQHVYVLLWDERLSYPWTKAKERLELSRAGLNHFSWLLSAHDKQSGHDLMPMLQEKIRAGKSTGNPRCENLFLETRCLLLPNDDHTADFLPVSLHIVPKHHFWHGTALEREERRRQFRAIAEGREDWRLFEKSAVSWEEPARVIAALEGKVQNFSGLNLPNQGYLDFLPSETIVEVPCEIENKRFNITKPVIPQALQPYLKQTAKVTDCVVRAALNYNLETLRDAVYNDPTIEDKELGYKTLLTCLSMSRLIDLFS